MSEKGLFLKYIIQKTNGKPVDRNAEYFLLRLDDGQKDKNHLEASKAAIEAYANSIGHTNKALKIDIYRKWLRT